MIPAAVGKTRPPVLIVGAGPTGLTLAACLARAGVVPRIIDQATTPPADRSRAMVIQPRTLELFEDLGIVDEALAAGLHIPALDVYAPSGRHAHLSFLAHAPVDSRYGGIFSLPQDKTEHILTELLAGDGLTVERGTTLVGVTSDATVATATLRHTDGRIEHARASWVFGADGAHSTVRESVGLPFDGVTYRDECLLGDIRIDWALPHDTISLCPSRAGVLLVFPLPEQQHFRVIMILPARTLSEDRHLDRAEFEQRLRSMTPRSGRTPHLLEALWLTRYHLHRRGVPVYRRGRVFVGGDAAHIHSPAGGQGMNTGIQDAYNIGWKLALVVQGKAPESLLDTYDAERHRIGEILLHGTDRLFGLLTGRGFLQGMARRVAPTLAGRLLDLPPIANRLTRFVSELNIRYPQSTLSLEGPGADRLGHDAPRAGDRAPDAPLADDGEERWLFDLMHGPLHTLLLFADPSASAPAGGASTVARIAAEVSARHASTVQPRVFSHVDAAHTRYGAERGAIYLVRPDGYIAFRSTLAGRDALMADLERRFSPDDGSAAR